MTDVGAAAASESAAGHECSQTDADVDVRLDLPDSESRHISAEDGDNRMSVSDQQTTDDVLQTAEDILDELDND